MPERTGFLVVLYGPDYCILESNQLRSMDLDRQLPEYVKPVPPVLDNLLRSSESYPPARALMMKELDRRRLPLEIAYEEIEKRLTYHLEAQRTSPYVLLRASRNNGINFTGGVYYWVVGLVDDDLKVRYQEPGVRWVSSDYQIYQADVSDFDVDEEALLYHFRGPAKEPSTSPALPRPVPPWRAIEPEMNDRYPQLELGVEEGEG